MSAFPISFVHSTPIPLARKIKHDLKRKKGEYKTYKVSDLVLGPLSDNTEWQKHIKKLLSDGITYSRDKRIKFKSVKVRDICVDDDVQRSLSPKHCADIGNPETFKVSYLSAIQCIKVPGKEEYHSFNAQHTVVVEAAYAYNGLWKDWAGDWLDLEVPVTYIETDDRAEARQAFRVFNGHGALKISPYHDHKTDVLIYRVDGNLDLEFKQAHKLQEITESLGFEFQSDNPDDPNIGLPGCITHISAARKYYDRPEHWRFILTTHKKYWPNLQLAGMEIDLYGFMYEYMSKIADVKSSEFQQDFLDPVHAIIQSLFQTPAVFGVDSSNTFKRWYAKTWDLDEKKAKVDAQGSFVLLMKMYRILKGTHKLPDIVDLYDNQKAGDVTAYLPDTAKKVLKKYG